MFGLMDSAGAGIRLEKYRSKQSASRSLKSRTSDRKTSIPSREENMEIHLCYFWLWKLSQRAWDVTVTVKVVERREKKVAESGKHQPGLRGVFFFSERDLERDKVKIMVDYSARKLERLRLTMWVISMFEERTPKSRIHTRSFLHNLARLRAMR